MQLIYQKQKLMQLLYHFHVVAGMRIAVFDRDGEEIVAYPESLCPFCEKLRKSPCALRDCMANDRQELKHCPEGGEVYRCHVGLTEAAAPISCDGVLLGYIMIGQVCGREEERKEICQKAEQYGLSFGKAWEEAKQVALVSREKMESALHLMTACTAYILSQGLILQQAESLPKQVMELIEAHYSEKLPLDFFCRQLSVSRNQLCRSVREETGRTVGELVLQKRIKEAKRLLQETRLPVSEIAGMVGIEDYNYFSKVFKAASGLTPSLFRAGSRREK